MLVAWVFIRSVDFGDILTFRKVLKTSFFDPLYSVLGIGYVAEMSESRPPVESLSPQQTSTTTQHKLIHYCYYCTCQPTACSVSVENPNEEEARESPDLERKNL